MRTVFKTPALLQTGVWQVLLQQAFTLVDEIAAHGIRDPFWTFGGGTVLMLRYREPYELWALLGREIKVETSSEIVAKKLWHRGDRVTARDLFDLAMVIEREPQALATAGTFLSKHREIFLQQVEQRKRVLKVQFDAIDVLDFRTSYKLAAHSARAFLTSL